jgi:predicted small metal-binding protein
MAKILHCRDAGFDCDAIVRGETVDEILTQVRPHAAQVHGVEVDPAMEAQLRTLVADD